MDTLEKYRQVIRKVIKDYSEIPYAFGDIQSQTIFDTEVDRYLLMIIGREGVKRVHGCLIHIDIIGAKVWIQRDGTEAGMTTELLKAGIPKDKIVLGFRSPEMRKHTGFATE
ncbi:XisI protein [Anaerolineales bacterium HSG24]|nr:XisI protein [Anaerolineales bacterium HSG24]